MAITSNAAHALYHARPLAAGHPDIEAQELDDNTARHQDYPMRPSTTSSPVWGER